jgi:hypothetical protein
LTPLVALLPPSQVLEHIVDALIEELAELSEGNWLRGRAGIRNLLELSNLSHRLANGYTLQSLIDPILGERHKVVRGLYFDKYRDANWKVSWHQDLTIAVKHRLDVCGYAAWSEKAGITHVQPPVSVLEKMVSLRFHLDESDETNGALQVLPGSHRLGRLGPSDIEHQGKTGKAEVCCVRRGGIMLMRPLLLHSSSVASVPRHRRVLHLEYANVQLAGGLEWYED